MHELTEWREWTLSGLDVTYLHFDYRFTLDIWSAERSLHITFESEFILSVSNNEDQIFDPEMNEMLGPLLFLLHRPVSSFKASFDGRCVLQFEDGTEIRGKPHPRFESWEATGTGSLIGIALLCGAGGGSPWGIDNR